MNRSYKIRTFCNRIVGCLIFTLVHMDSSNATESNDKADTYTDALIPMVVLEAEKLPPPLKLVDKAPNWAEGLLATQQVRPAGAIIADFPLFKSTTKQLLMLTLLGKVKLDPQGKPTAENNSTQQVWCKDIVNPDASIDCYQDSDGDGNLDKRARGFLPLLEALSVNRIGPFEPIRVIPYRKAHLDELPRYDIDYLYCRIVDSQIKYARRIKKVGFGERFVQGQCESFSKSAVNQPEEESMFILDQTKIKVRTVDTTRTAQMAEGMPAGLFVGHLRTDHPITDIAHTKRFSEESNEALTELPSVYVLTPPIIAKDPIKVGERLFTAEVKHSITGLLREAAIPTTPIKDAPNELIPAGAKMFGIQMQRTGIGANLDADIVWCYPAPLNAQINGAKCIARDRGNSSHVVDVLERFHISSLTTGSFAPSIDPPLIDRQAIDFGEPIVLEILIEKIAKRKITIRVTVDRQSEQNKSSKSIEIERSKDGNGYILIGDGILVLEPIDKNTIRISEKHPVTMGSDAEVADVIAVQRSLRAR